MKPPVEAPTSRQTRPAGSIPNASSAAASLCPPRLTYGLRRVHADRRRGIARGRRPCGRAGRRPPPPRAPCRPAPAPARGCASRPGRARRAAGRAGMRCAFAPVGRSSDVTRLSWHSPLHADVCRSGAPDSVADAAPGRAAAARPASRRERLADLRGEAGGVEAEDAAQVRRRSRGRRTGRPGSRRSGRRPRGSAGSARRASSSSSRTPIPKPPVTTLSSNVTTSCLPRAWSRISWRSSGLANRALMTPTDQPSASSASAASTRAPRSARTRRTAGRGPRAGPRPGRSGAIAGSTGGEPEPGVARVVQGERVVLGERGPEQRAQLLLVLRAGDHEVRQLALGGQREHALVARAVLADEPGPVDGEQDRLVVLADVVDGLVEGALEERRVERDDRPHARPSRGPSRASWRAARRCRRRRTGPGTRPGTASGRSRWACRR